MDSRLERLSFSIEDEDEQSVHVLKSSEVCRNDNELLLVKNA